MGLFRRKKKPVGELGLKSGPEFWEGFEKYMEETGASREETERILRARDEMKAVFEAIDSAPDPPLASPPQSERRVRRAKRKK